MAPSLPSTPRAGSSATLSPSPVLAEFFLPDRTVPEPSYAFSESPLSKRQGVTRDARIASGASETNQKSLFTCESLLANQFLTPAAANWLASTGEGSGLREHIYLASSPIPFDLGFDVPANDLCPNAAGLGKSRLTDDGSIRHDVIGNVAASENAVGAATEMADLFDWSSWDVDTDTVIDFPPSPVHNNILATPNFPPHQFIQTIAPPTLLPSSTLNNAPSLAYAGNPTQGQVEARITCAYPGCSRTFRRAGDCRRHMGKHQTPGFKCIVADCNKTFYRLDKVRDHCRQGHGIALSG